MAGLRSPMRPRSLCKPGFSIGSGLERHGSIPSVPGEAEPAVRATLDFGFAVITLGLAAGASLLLFTGVTFTLSNGLIALALCVAVTNGLFDYHTALVRACFDDRLFARLVLVKNIFAFALMGGGAFIFGSAKMTLIGTIISLGGSIVTARAALRDPASKPALARFSIARSLMAYSLPIVGANLLYLSIPLANRSILAIVYGFSETGQFSLAYDFGTKAIQAIGSALDIVLFQIAVATHELHGPTQARQQIARNMTIVIAMVLPACTGLWLTLPSIAQLVVPAEFRRPFRRIAAVDDDRPLLHGHDSICINPIFQIEKKTAPLIVAALAACAVDPFLLLILPRDGAWIEPCHRSGRGHGRGARRADRLCECGTSGNGRARAIWRSRFLPMR